MSGGAWWLNGLVRKYEWKNERGVYKLADKLFYGLIIRETENRQELD